MISKSSVNWIKFNQVYIFFILVFLTVNTDLCYCKTVDDFLVKAIIL